MSDPYIIGFSDSVHDRSVCLFRGTEPVVVVEEERLTRLRHGLDFRGLERTDATVFTKLDLDGGSSAAHTARLRVMIDYCLSTAGITDADVSLWIGNSLHTAFPLPDRAVYLNHHLAHAASAFYGSAAPTAAVLVIDGYGDAITADTYETVSIYRGVDRGLELLHRVEGGSGGVHLANSAGILYRIGTLMSGFSVVDEGKAMGLAGYGRPVHLETLLSYLVFGATAVEIDNEAIWKAMRDIPCTTFEERADMAASFQAAVEEVMLFYARLAKEMTGCDVLCMAGGVALNCVGNQRVLDEAGFAEVSVFPAAADNGISMGAAYFGAHVLHGGERGAGLVTPCLGRTYSRNQTMAALETLTGVDITEVGPVECARRGAAHIARGELVMWFQEGAEIGPRALGHRSVFGDPRTVATRDHINAAVKSREPFRPLAPIVLEDEAGEWFACGRSPYMLFTPPVREKTRALAPAVVHTDGTARVQTLAESDNPVVHRLLVEFQRRTGVPMVINTSFNLRGEPIVETPSDATAAFAESPVPVLCIDGFHVVKHGRVG